jgi:pantothenate kinase
LNAKLLFSNKLFRSYNLTNEQKSKVIDSLDRTNTVREVKLVYSTLAESMKFATNSPKKSAKPMAEGASRVQTSTKPTAQKAIVSEGTTYANRFKELAGILK